MPETQKPRAVLVTGGSSGIGLACVNHLVDRGYTVFVGLRSPNRLPEEMSRSAIAVPLDLNDIESVRSASAFIVEMTGETGLYALVNCAGVCVTGPLELTPENELLALFETNVVGAHAITRLVLPALRVSCGRIVNISSTSALFPSPLTGAYAISKAAAEMLTRSMELEYARFGIRISAVYPGVVATPFWTKIAERERAVLASAGYSEYANLYGVRQGMLAKFGEKSTPPVEVAKIVGLALAAQRPRRRYVVGNDALRRMLAFRVLPERLMFWLASRRLPVPPVSVGSLAELE